MNGITIYGLSLKARKKKKENGLASYGSLREVPGVSRHHVRALHALFNNYTYDTINCIFYFLTPTYCARYFELERKRKCLSYDFAVTKYHKLSMRANRKKHRKEVEPCEI